jgi:membrane protease YdiL (CAAX protease family)
MSDASSDDKSSAQPSSVPGWRPWHATLASLLIFVTGQLALGFMLVALGIDLDSLTTSGHIGIGIVSSLISVGLAFWFAGWFGPAPSRRLGFVKPPPATLALIGLAMLIFIFGSAILSLVVDSLWPGFEAEQEQDIGLGLLSSQWQYVGTFILLVILAPISEEIVFRGILFAGWRSLGFGPAAVVSSLLFGLAHWQPNVALATAVLGWLLAYLYERTGSLWAPIGLHSVKNALAFALVYGGGIS